MSGDLEVCVPQKRRDSTHVIEMGMGEDGEPQLVGASSECSNLAQQERLEPAKPAVDEEE